MLSVQFNWKTVLAPDEMLQKEFAVSLRFLQLLLAATIVGSIVVCFANIFAGIIVLLSGVVYCFYLYKAKHYALTDKRMVLVESFLGETITSVDYSQITDIEIEQSVIDQMGGWGAMVINTAGTHVPEIRLSFIDQPQQIKQNLDMIRDKQPILSPVQPQ